MASDWNSTPAEHPISPLPSPDHATFLGHA
jgi:hypothetical protein